MACYSKRGRDYGYPIIGYVKNNNDVEKALIAQYTEVFNQQLEANSMLEKVPSFYSRISSILGLDSSGSPTNVPLKDIIGGQGP